MTTDSRRIKPKGDQNWGKRFQEELLLEARKVEFLLAHLCHGVLACQPDSYGFQKTVDKCPLKSY
jgi:hypothetical protein